MFAARRVLRGRVFFSTAVGTPVKLMSKKPKVVILGSGWGGFRLANTIDKSKYEVNIVSPTNHFLFTPYLPQTAVGTLEFRVIQEPVRTIKGLGAYFQAKTTHVDLQNRTVEIEDVFHRGSSQSPKRQHLKTTLDYDLLVMAVGCKSNTFGTPGVLEQKGKAVHFLKNLHHARQLRNRLLECFERASMPGLPASQVKRLLTFVVVGGGPTSCEFVAELADFLAQDVARWYPDLSQHVSVCLVEAGPGLLGTFEKSLVDWVDTDFAKRGVDVRTQTAVQAIIERPIMEKSKEGEPERFETVAQLSDGSEIPFGTLVWSAGLKQRSLVETMTELQKGPTGRILTDDLLRVKRTNGAVDDRVYAIGDCAVMQSTPLAPLAQVAEQQADYLAHCFNTSYYEPLCKKGPTVVLGEPKPSPPASFPPLPSFLFKKRSRFHFVNRGSMVSMGAGKGLVDLTHVELPDSDGVTAKGAAMGTNKISGAAAFLMWNGTYLTKQYSWANMVLNPMFKLKCFLFGRDISRF